MSENFVRYFAATALAGLLCLVSVTGARINLLREEVGVKALSTLEHASDGPATGLEERMYLMISKDPRWQAVVCVSPGSTIRLGDVQTESLTKIPVVIYSGNRWCEGLFRVIEAAGIYSIIRDTAVATTALFAGGALILLTANIRRRENSIQPTRSLAPPPEFSPGTEHSHPEGHASEKTR